MVFTGGSSFGGVNLSTDLPKSNSKDEDPLLEGWVTKCILKIKFHLKKNYSTININESIGFFFEKIYMSISKFNLRVVKKTK